MSEEAQGEGREGLPKRFASHAPVFEPKDRLYCWKKTEAPVIRNRTLAAKERTDLIVLQFPPVAATESAVLSLGRALVLAGARILEVDSRELDARPKPSQTGGASDLLVFDSGSSGAGHCRELFDDGEEWFSEARNVLEGDPNHDKKCETACLDCILDFSGQFGASKLDRHAALKLLD